MSRVSRGPMSSTRRRGAPSDRVPPRCDGRAVLHAEGIPGLDLSADGPIEAEFGAVVETPVRLMEEKSRLKSPARPSRSSSSQPTMTVCRFGKRPASIRSLRVDGPLYAPQAGPAAKRRYADAFRLSPLLRRTAP